MKSVKVVSFDLMADRDLLLNGACGLCSVLVKAGPMPLWWIGLDGSAGVLDREKVERACREKNSKALLRELIRDRVFSPPSVAAFEPVSVVVCTRNRSVMLKRCLSALLKLDHPCFEVIVVDNAPADHLTREAVHAVGARYVLEPRPGLDHARNAGIRAASYPCIAFTDDDAVADSLWLQRINAAFRDPGVDAVTGFVAPLVLETAAQRKFEWSYGGMSHGFSRIDFNGRTMNASQRMCANSCGVGANMAFRRRVFEVAGLFDTCLDVGTPSGGGGDIEMFHRALSAGFRIVYDPSVLVWHEHRATMKALRKQVYNNGMSFGCYLMACVRKGSVTRKDALFFFFRNWLWQWFFRQMMGRKGQVSRMLLLMELKGMANSPWAYHRTYRASVYEGNGKMHKLKI